MTEKRGLIAVVGALALAWPTLAAAQAQPPVVSAVDPAGLVNLLDLAGYQPKLGKDDLGDPKIEIDLSGYSATLFFYGCDETAHTGCTSLQIQVGFDRKKPWTDKEALALAKKYRFASVWLDDSGDPWLQWDIVTGDGIPAKVFLQSINMFRDTVDDAGDIVFAGEG